LIGFTLQERNEINSVLICILVDQSCPSHDRSDAIAASFAANYFR
jgi:hypothetical protein